VVWGLPVLPHNREVPHAPHRAPEPVPDHRLRGVTAVTNPITHFRLTASVSYPIARLGTAWFEAPNKGFGKGKLPQPQFSWRRGMIRKSILVFSLVLVPTAAL